LLKVALYTKNQIKSLWLAYERQLNY
jgi:hypothetical protein